MEAVNHVYEVRLRKDRHGVDLISDVLPFGRLWYGEPNAIANAIGYAMHSSRSHHAVIRVYDAAGNVIVFQRTVGTMMRPTDLSPLFYPSQALRLERLR
jgi:hypothetical protein